MKNIFRKKSDGKTILILSECQQGALKAGRYALKHLYDNHTQIILLQTYAAPKFGLTMTRNLSSILETVSKEDLTLLKNTLIKEFDIPSDNIVKLAIEGDLTTIAQQEFKNCENLTVVIGTDCTPLNRRDPYKRITSFMTITGIRPIFIIDEFTTRIDQSKIYVSCENGEEMDRKFNDFLINNSERDNISVEYVTNEKFNLISLPEKTTAVL